MSEVGVAVVLLCSSVRLPMTVTYHPQVIQVKRPSRLELSRLCQCELVAQPVIRVFEPPLLERANTHETTLAIVLIHCSR